MSQKLQFKIRLDERLHALINEAAGRHRQSVNAEIVSRLDQSFASEPTKDSIVTAEDAQKMADKALSDDYGTFLSDCMEAIKSTARAGRCSLHVLTDRYTNEAVQPVITKLRELGYSVLLMENRMQKGSHYLEISFSPVRRHGA